MKSQSFFQSLCLWLLLSLTLFAQISLAATPVPDAQKQEAAASVIALEDPGSKAAVRELVSTLDDAAVRALLIERLDAVAEAKEQAAQDTPAGIVDVISSGFATYGQNALAMLGRADEIPGTLGVLGRDISRDLEPGGLSRLFLVIVTAIVLGLCGERLVAFLFRKRKQSIIEASPTSLWGILSTLYTRLSFDVSGVAAFAIISYLLISYEYPKGTFSNLLAYTMTSWLIAAGFAYVISRFYFAPERPDLRICNTTDQRAKRLTVSYSILAAFIVVVHNTYKLFWQIGIENYDGHQFMAHIGFLMNISMYVAAAVTIWYNRAGLTEILLENKKRITLAIGDEAPEDVSWFAVNWPKIAITLIVLKYFLVEVIINLAGAGIYSTSAVYVTFIMIFLWPCVDAMISLFAWKSINAPEDQSPTAAIARRSMQQGLLRIGRVLVIGAVLYLLARLWGLNILDLAETGLGAKAAAGLVEILLIGLFAYISWELVSILVDYWLAQESGAAPDEDAGGGEIGGVGLSRTATVLPLLQKTAKVIIVLVTIVMILDNWGVNIGPIIAGAGVVGLAIGFGAQTLVKDIVSGMFFLADDAFRVGEYIDVGGTMGNVEKISLRSLRLRHHRGLVHTIPYGEIPKLTNYSRDWVIMKLRFRVPFDTDVNQVKKIFKQIGTDLMAHPELGEDFLQPFKSQGVAEVDDNGLVVRGKFMAKPGKQFMIRKEVFVRVQKALEEAGIPFARKQVIVHIPGMDDDKKLTEEDRRVIAAAASEAAEDELSPNEQEKPKSQL